MFLPFYVRYEDDIALAAPAEAIDNIVNEFNGYHNRLQFTVEFEKKRSLNFLDTSIRVVNNTLHTDWFHKDTFSGRYLSYLSPSDTPKNRNHLQHGRSSFVTITSPTSQKKSRILY